MALFILCPPPPKSEKESKLYIATRPSYLYVLVWLYVL